MPQDMQHGGSDMQHYMLLLPRTAMMIMMIDAASVSDIFPLFVTTRTANRSMRFDSKSVLAQI